MLNAKIKKSFVGLVGLALLTPWILTACQPSQPEQSSQTGQEHVQTEKSTEQATTGHAGHTQSSASPSAQVEQSEQSKQTETAHENKASIPVEVESASILLVPEAITETIALLTLKNKTDQDIRLRAFSSPLAGHGMLMVTVKQGGMSGMKETPFLTIPAEKTLTMKYDGDHLMLMKLKHSLKEGESWALELEDTKGRILKVDASVIRP